jgi:hypothetical protein
MLRGAAARTRMATRTARVFRPHFSGIDAARAKGSARGRMLYAS